VILDFGNKTAEDIFHGVDSKEARKLPKNLWNTAHRKLDAINAAHELKDLSVPPGNRLEALKGNRVGQHSIRINNQYRICFVFADGNASQVEIVDYH
jgi:proteic killer suppression protein